MVPAGLVHPAAGGAHPRRALTAPERREARRTALILVPVVVVATLVTRQWSLASSAALVGGLVIATVSLARALHLLARP